MKILGILIFVEILILIILATISDIDIDIFLSEGVIDVMAQILGTLIIIYPVINLVMHSKTTLKNWHFFGITATLMYCVITMFILSVIFKDPKFIQIEFVGYYLQTGISAFVILVLRRFHGKNNIIESA